jgi:ABC-type nitrate/sulfonate/bicarbonate transport system substrate-binding protein
MRPLNRSLSYLILLMIIGSLKLPEADARIVVGVSTVNVAFLPIYLTQDKGFFKDEGLDMLVVMICKR